MKNKRKIPLVVISDVHLGTYGCQATELLQYLKSIQPKTLVLNGDIIDMWNFSKSYFPSSHMNVLRHIIKMSANGTRLIYITGNHDEVLRKYSDLILGKFELVDKLVLELDGKKAWIFHGDVFDSSTQGYAKIVAKIGGKGYDLLISAWKILESRIKNELWIVADDSDHYLDSLIKSCGVTNVRIVPLTNNLFELYDKCSLFLSTSRFQEPMTHHMETNAMASWLKTFWLCVTLNGVLLAPILHHGIQVVAPN